MGDPANWACAIALIPLVTPGPAVSTANPGVLVSLPVASAANAAVCSCRTSSSRIGGSALTAPSYIGKTCAPESVNIVSTPWALATATASSPAWPLSSRSVSEVMAGRLPTGHRRETVSPITTVSFASLGQVRRVRRPQRRHHREQQVGPDLGRAGRDRQLEVEGPEERLGVEGRQERVGLAGRRARRAGGDASDPGFDDR